VIEGIRSRNSCVICDRYPRSPHLAVTRISRPGKFCGIYFISPRCCRLRSRPLARSSTPRGFPNSRPSRHLPRLAGSGPGCLWHLFHLSALLQTRSRPLVHRLIQVGILQSSRHLPLCGLGQTRFFAASVSSLHIVANEIKASGLTNRASRVSRSSQLVSPQSLR
jgi:hypothetical protein